MRIAKTLAMLFALVLVVMCFNAPILFSAEEHPWDGDGPGDGSDGTIIDPTIDTTIVVPPDEEEDFSTYNPDGLNPDGLLFDLQFFFMFYSIPDYPAENSGASGNTN